MSVVFAEQVGIILTSFRISDKKKKLGQFLFGYEGLYILFSHCRYIAVGVMKVPKYRHLVGKRRRRQVAFRF
jgi:hypothetical protein